MLMMEPRTLTQGCHVDVSYSSSVWRAILYCIFRIDTTSLEHTTNWPMCQKTPSTPITFPRTCMNFTPMDWVIKQARMTYWPKEGVSLHYIYLFQCFISVSKCVDMLIALKKLCSKRRTTNLCYFGLSTNTSLWLVFLWKFERRFRWGPQPLQQIQYVHDRVTVPSSSFYNERLICW